MRPGNRATMNTIMDRAKLLALLDEERRSVCQDGQVLESLPAVSRLAAADGSYHVVIASSLGANADAAIAAEVEHHRRFAAEFEWKLYAHDAPPDLLERLRLHGFDIGPREAVLVLELAHPPGWITEPPAHRVVRADSLELVNEYRRVAEAISGEDSGLASELAAAVTTGSLHQRGYISYDGDVPAAVGRLHTHPQSRFGGLYGGATLPDHRGRGLYRANLAARGQDAMALGAQYLLVDALPTSRPILERLGFQWLTDSWPCVWQQGRGR